MWGVIVILGLIMMVTIYPMKQRQLRIARWLKTLHLETHFSIFQELFSNLDGFALSKEARAPKDAIEYTYGEIEFFSFIALLSLSKLEKNSVFYDLGSGVGKAVLACAMVFPVRQSYGIELFSTLHEAALAQKNKLAQLPAYSAKAKQMTFIQANFLEISYPEATHIFVNATTLIGISWTQLCDRLALTSPGTIVITTSKKLSNDAFSLVKATSVQMSWGTVSAYIQQRRG